MDKIATPEFLGFAAELEKLGAAKSDKAPAKSAGKAKAVKAAPAPEPTGKKLYGATGGAARRPDPDDDEGYV